METIISQMECNGYAYFNKQAFDLKSKSEFCYVPENADSILDCYTYNDLLNAVKNWEKGNKDFFIDNKTTPEKLTQLMFSELSWEFPETWLNELS